MVCRLREFAQLYDVIKNERNKCVSLIQASSQKAAEVKEKLKIFDNETEILRTSVAQKEKYVICCDVIGLHNGGDGGGNTLCLKNKHFRRF